MNHTCFVGNLSLLHVLLAHLPTRLNSFTPSTQLAGHRFSRLAAVCHCMTPTEPFFDQQSHLKLVKVP